MQAPAVAPERGILSYIARPALIGSAVLAVFILVFFGWGSMAPLSAGALAAGQISPEGNRRTIQHLEGGIIQELRVRDGDTVARGDILVTLEETRARASFQVLLGQQHLLAAQRARLRSEQLQHDTPRFPENLVALAETDEEVREILTVQRDLFDQRTELHRNRRDVLGQRIGQLEAEIDGLEAQIRSQTRRQQLIRSEIADTRSLVERGLSPRPRLLALQREEASIEEQLAGNRAAIARSRQAIGETEVQMLSMDSQRLDEISTELNDVQARLAEVSEEILASEDVLRRTEITAPIDGTVVNLRYTTTGGVIRPGDPVLDIVPMDEALIIDARMSPLDVDLVSRGQAAYVHLSALPQDNLPRIAGEVIDVSADALVDEISGESYFRIRVRVDMEELDRLAVRIDEDLTLLPGMPAEVLVVTGERTLLQYLIQPLRDSLRNALRES
ncbi:HlyD family type I secretion periplasmic adaptor subunit [Maricaulis sp. CAU 1757]